MVTRLHVCGLAARVSVLLVMILSRWAAGSGPMPSAFVYQGRLHVQGSPAEGLYDLTFALFDSPTGGRQIGSPQFHGGVEVTGGYFTVVLDFGPNPGVFNGLTRYLGIAVKRSGTREPTIVLSPRQKVHASPYANRAFSAQELTPLKFIPEYMVRMDIVGQPSQYFHYFYELKSQTRIIEYREGTGTGVRKLAGESGPADVELRRFASENGFLRAWVNTIREGGLYQRDMTFFVLDASGRAMDGWEYFDAWPRQVYYETDVNLDTVVETAVIVAERSRRIVINPDRWVPDRWYPGQQPAVHLPLLVEVAGQSMRAYDEMSGIGWSIKVMEYRSGTDNYVHKLAGEFTAMNTSLARPVVNGDLELMTWRGNIVNGVYDKRQVHILMQNTSGGTVLAVMLEDAWPAELSTTYDGAKNRVEETLLLAVDGLQW